PVWRVAGRCAVSLVRRRVPGLRSVPVTIDAAGTRIVADLSGPFGLSLYRYGFTQPEAALVQHLLRPGDVFVDGGAHIGVFTLLAAAAVGPTGRVIACEPVPENMALLEANVALNGFGWVETHRVALGERRGQAEFFSFEPGSALGSYAPATSEGRHRLTVDVVPLDEVVGSPTSGVRLVKLDIEGAELLALRGAPALLAAKPDFLLELEPEHLARQNATVGELRDLFTTAGYEAFEIRGNAARVSLVPMTAWRRPPGSPNVLVSARPLLSGS
ncbi:MAG: FkbM family methyltransferase, partial [Acidimicrobiales bacterium]